MKVCVRLFASLADRAGTMEATVQVAGDDVACVWAALVERFPRLAEVSPRPLAACDMEYSAWDRKIDGVREVAFLPPVSGG